MPIHRFPMRDAGRRWIEACANSYLSRLEYLQVVERQYFDCHGLFDKQYYYQKRNGAFLLKCGAVPTLWRLRLMECSPVLTVRLFLVKESVNGFNAPRAVILMSRTVIVVEKRKFSKIPNWRH